MNSIRNLRKYQYDYHTKFYPYINDWKKCPYTWFKARLYMEASAVLVYFLLKTKVKPNMVTIIYGLLGLFGGILLAIPVNQTILIAVLIFFLKGVLDWSDGHLARVRGQTSITGALLDSYGAFLGALGLRMGLGFYVAHKSGMAIFYYLTALIPLFYAAKLTSRGYTFLFCEYLKPEKLKEHKNRNLEGSIKTQSLKHKAKNYNSIKNFFYNFLDDRARTVDFVCFLLLLEIFTPIFITWIVFLGFLIKQFLIFCTAFYIVARGEWLEKKLEDKLEEIGRIYAEK